MWLVWFVGLLFCWWLECVILRLVCGVVEILGLVCIFGVLKFCDLIEGYRLVLGYVFGFDLCCFVGGKVLI